MSGNGSRSVAADISVQSPAVRYRLIYGGLGLALLAVVALAVAFGTPSTEGRGRPEVIEELSPLPGDLVPRQVEIMVNLPQGYDLDLWIDDFRIPAEEIRFEQNGVYRWQPAPGRTFTELSPGEHTVEIFWDTLSGLPDVGSYKWSFTTY